MDRVYLILQVILFTWLISSCGKEFETNQIRITNRTGTTIDRISVSSVLSLNLDRQTVTFDTMEPDETTNFIEIMYFNRSCPMIEVLSSQDTLLPVLDDCIFMDPTTPAIYTIFLFRNGEDEIYYQFQEE